MQALNPLGEYRTQLNRRITEHVLGTTQGTHGVVVDVEAETVEAQPNAHPIEVTDQGVTSFEHAIKHVVYMLRRVVIAHHGD